MKLYEIIRNYTKLYETMRYYSKNVERLKKPLQLIKSRLLPYAVTIDFWHARWQLLYGKCAMTGIYIVS